MATLEELVDGILASEDVDVKALVKLSRQEETGKVMEGVVPRVQRLVKQIGGMILSKVVQQRINSEGLGERTPGVHSYRERSWQTVVGELTLSRGYLKNDEGCYTFPADDVLGLPRGDCTRELEYVVTLLSTDGAFETEMERLRAILGIEISGTLAAKQVEFHGQRQVEAEKHEQHCVFDQRQPVASQAPAGSRLVVGMDAAKYRSREAKDEPWKEMKIGSVGHLDEQGKVKKGKAYIAETDKDSLGRQLYIEAMRSGMASAQEIVTIADGARMNWNLIAEHFPEHRVEILDYYHAAQHVVACATARYGEGTQQAKQWGRTQRRRLKKGQVHKVLEELHRCRKALGRKKPEVRKLLSDNLAYFQDNQHRMNYARYRKRGYPIGSGFIESACKQIVTARLRGSGMRWRRSGAIHIAKLRALALSGRLYHFVVHRPHAEAA